MQHHGAPTRLLDWTLSPYVALYFALEQQPTGNAALWGLDTTWLDERSYEMLNTARECPDRADFSGYAQYVNRVFFHHGNQPIVISAAPMRLHERMTAQQGMLLCTLRHHELGFPRSLLHMLLNPRPVRAAGAQQG